MTAPTTTSTAWPSGISSPWASIGANGQNGLVAVLEGVAVSFVVVSLLIRMFARHNFAAYRADDYTFLVAVVCLVVQAMNTGG
jgi:undecaprenyl pyrophosphate phosphatase UppP